MDHHTIDRLFREKLDGMEKTPSPSAWDEVEKQISKKKKPAVYYWVAASITLLLVSWVVWPDNSPGNPLASQLVDHPPLEETIDLSTPIAVAVPSSSQKREVVEPSKRALPSQAVAINEEREVNKQQGQVSTEMTLVPQEAIATLNETLIPVENELVLPSELTTSNEKATLKQVKITYIASNSLVLPDKTDSTGMFKKFIAFTGKIDPGEMLADIKTAKDNLFSSGLKTKKERRAMIP